MLVLLLDFAEPRENLFHFVESRRVGHRVLQRLELVMQISETAASGDGFIQYGTARHFFHILAEIADGQLPGHRHFAFIRRFFADDHAEQCGFSSDVRL